MNNISAVGHYLSPKQVEAIFNLPITTLEKWRSLRIGPPYRKCGKHIRYTFQEVEKWIEHQKVITN